MSFMAPPGYQPVYSPAIPYLGPIYGGLREGASIYLQGSVPDKITRFFVNLLCGQSESSDIAVHFNPRFDGWDKVVFNSRRDNAWDNEEKIRSMPFSKGDAFEIVITCSPHDYQFKVNGKDFYTFKHRLPLAKVCAIQIGGDVAIQSINVIGGGYPGGGMGGGYPGDCGGGGYPGDCGGGGFPGSNLPSMAGQPIYNPPIPYSGAIPGGMFPKRTVIIRGMVPYKAGRFGINFLVSRSRDIAFHVNPRIKDGVVVRNTMMGGHWGQEERQLGGDNPFKEGQYFDMSVRCGSDRFKVFVNGHPLFDYSHRMRNVNEIDGLEVAGDVQISYIHF
ncbi:galectin-4-like [Corythoichthys intestinalis]|uniref:galectin-4-like n=1 Tax=Corythoichthys intestinalis TaxID=161448 RepID=UPI0025A56119|nr:galectin-4-like [Corythoichthys intestinalis]XP_061797637.1 galectin-4-like [Nerophis lumbriciformis]